MGDWILFIIHSCSIGIKWGILEDITCDIHMYFSIIDVLWCLTNWYMSVISSDPCNVAIILYSGKTYIFLKKGWHWFSSKYSFIHLCHFLVRTYCKNWVKNRSNQREIFAYVNGDRWISLHTLNIKLRKLTPFHFLVFLVQ